MVILLLQCKQFDAVVARAANLALPSMWGSWRGSSFRGGSEGSVPGVSRFGIVQGLIRLWEKSCNKSLEMWGFLEETIILENKGSVQGYHFYCT